MILEYRKDYTDIEAIYPEFLQDIRTVLEEYSQIPVKDFAEDIQEIKVIKYKLDAFPEEAFADMSTIYAEVQGYASRVTSILIGMYQYRADLQRVFSNASKIYKKIKMRTLATNEYVQKLKNQGLQEAYVSNTFERIVAVIDNIEVNLGYIDESINMVLVRERDLDRAIVNISRQQRVVEGLMSLNYTIKPQHKITLTLNKDKQN